MTDPTPAPLPPLSGEEIAQIQARQQDGMLVAHGMYGYIVLTAEERDRLCAQVTALRQEIETDNQLLKHRDELLAAIPECPEHGACVPHALGWIEASKLQVTALRDFLPRITSGYYGQDRALGNIRAELEERLALTRGMT